ncbi:MAG: hypothetical protein ACR2JC_11305 [Chloroflexota bacterium]|nr:MAG: hypothetical protein DLM70_01435 [Chloroflexota bacterium]
MTPDELQLRAERVEGTRAVLEGWIRRNLRLGLHFGVFPVDGNDVSKPTLLKPGAEMIAQLFAWRFHFVADLESLGMYSATPSGTFAYRCSVLSSEGHTVGEGRGAAQTQEPAMLNPNKAIKMALKRAQVDAVLRCAGLSEYFTQDLEEPVYVAPEPAPSRTETPKNGHNGHKSGSVRALEHHTGNQASPTQIGSIRAWLKRTRRSEREIIEHYGLVRLEDLSIAVADRVLRRLVDLGRGYPGS